MGGAARLGGVEVRTFIYYDHIFNHVSEHRPEKGSLRGGAACTQLILSLCEANPAAMTSYWRNAGIRFVVY